MVITIDEYLKEEGITGPLSFEDIEKRCTEKHGASYMEEYGKVLDFLMRLPTKEAVLKLYDHHTQYGNFWAIGGINHEQTQHNLPIINSNLTKAENILDLGCSDCFKTIFYALNHPDKKFTAMDMNAPSLELAEEKIKKYDVKNIELICKDLYDLPSLKREFDHILAVNILHECHVPSIGEGKVHGVGHGRRWDMDFRTKLHALNLALTTPGQLIVSLNYQDGEAEHHIFNYDFKPAADKVGLELLSKERRFFKKGDVREYNGLYVFTRKTPQE